MCSTGFSSGAYGGSQWLVSLGESRCSRRIAARTVSGVVGDHLGWREMYAVAAAVMVALALALRALLPRPQRRPR